MNMLVLTLGIKDFVITSNGGEVFENKDISINHKSRKLQNYNVNYQRNKKVLITELKRE